MRSLLPNLCLLLATAPLCAQRYVVDSAGSGDFRDLPAAVAAVPDGAVLFVKPGGYSSFMLRNQGLTIVAQAQPCFVHNGTGAPVVIANLDAAKSVTICGLGIGQDLMVSACAGSVVLQGVDSTRTDAQWTFRDCGNVHLLDVTIDSSWLGGPGTLGIPSVVLERCTAEITRCRVQGSNTWTSGSFQGTPGGTAVTVAGSTLWLAQSTLLGGKGRSVDIQLPVQPAGPGGHGLVVTDASVVQVAGASVLRGGNGGAALLYPGAGGDGVRSDATSQVTVLGGQLVGGEGGASTIAGPGPKGLPLRGPVAWDPGASSPRATSVGAFVPNGVVRLQLATGPNALCALLVGTRPLCAAAAVLNVGAAFVTPELAFWPLVADAAGALEVPITIPAGYPGSLPAYVQFAAFEPTLPALSATGSLLLIGRY